MRNAKALITCAMATLLVCGCAGGGATVSTTTVSIGQQLIDLQNSLNSGAMSQAQYDKAKQDLIKRALD